MAKNTKKTTKKTVKTTTKKAETTKKVPHLKVHDGADFFAHKHIISRPSRIGRRLSILIFRDSL